MTAIRSRRSRERRRFAGTTRSTIEAAAKRAAEVVVAEDDSIPDLHVQRFVAHHIHDGGAAGLDGGAFDEQDPALGVARRVVGVQRGVVLHRPGEVVQYVKAYDEPGRGFAHCGVEQPIAAAHIVDAGACDIDRRAVADLGRRRRFVLDVQAADPQRIAGGRQHETVVEFGRARDHGARHDHAAAADGEGAVDGKPKRSIVVLGFGGACRQFEAGAKILNAGPGLARQGDDLCIGKERARGQGADLVAHFVEALAPEPGRFS